MTLVAAVTAAAGDETFAGLPRAAHVGPQWSVQVLQNPGFLVGYSAARRQPLWVAYRATAAKGHRVGRRPDFAPDARLEKPVTPQEYGWSRYQRGHLAPNFIIAKLYGADAQRATFLLSNVSPQRKRLNQLVWQRLEEAEADDVAPAAGELWVTTGPVFAGRAPTLKSGIAVPEAFYRIWLDVSAAGEPRVLAFIVPQDVCGTEPLSRYLGSVDEVEQRTGLDFFHALADVQEDALERDRATGGWHLERFDRKPPRYADKFGRLQC